MQFAWEIKNDVRQKKLLGDLFCVSPCVILFLCFSVLLALRLPRLVKRKLILVLFVHLFDVCLFGSVGFLFLCVWEGLRFVTVALPGLFSYFFWYFPLNAENSRVSLMPYVCKQEKNNILVPVLSIALSFFMILN